MKIQKIIWYEGMKLDPHHFQQADRYINYYINSRLDMMDSDQWGLEALIVDNASLASGIFSLVECCGIMPDGTIIKIPENDPIPNTRHFEKMFSPMTDRLEVCLVIPVEKISGKNCNLEENVQLESIRYLIQDAEVVDFNTGTNIRRIETAKLNFQIRFGGESLEDFISLKLGEIIRSSEGKYKMENKFIPSCLKVSVSEVLLDQMRNLLSLLVSKSKELRAQLNIKKAELSITQVEILQLLQTLNTHIPTLNYYINSQHIHPVTLYAFLLILTGQLSAFSNLDTKLDSLPIYDHKHLSQVFNPVFDEIFMLLNVQKTIERKDIIVPLKKHTDTLFVGQLSSNHIAAQFFLAVTGELGEKKIITELAKNIKISAYEEIFAVHQAGIQGVNIEYVARPPSGISSNTKAHYFKIIKEGRFWDKIVSKTNIAFFIASEFKSIQMELVLIL